MPFQDCAALADASRTVRRQIIDQHIAWLNDCAGHSIGVLVIHVCPEQDTPPPPNRYIIDSLKPILNTAEKLDIRLAVENTRRNDYLDLVFSEFDSVHLGLCYDSSHDFLWSRQPTEILGKYGSRLITTHLSDNDGLEDRHWPPGEGVIDWPKLVKALPHQTYTGPLILELLPKDSSQPPDLFLAKAYRSICSLTEMLAPTWHRRS